MKSIQLNPVFQRLGQVARRGGENVFDGVLNFHGTIASTDTKHAFLLYVSGLMTMALFSLALDCAMANWGPGGARQPFSFLGALKVPDIRRSSHCAARKDPGAQAIAPAATKQACNDARRRGAH